MAEVQIGHANGTSDVTNAKKRKGFWTNLFGRSSNPTKKQDDQQPKHESLMSSLMTSARDAAVKKVADVAEDEATKEVEAAFNNNNNGSQPADTSATVTNEAQDTSTSGDFLSESVDWAKRMANSAQQKMQGLQNLAS